MRSSRPDDSASPPSPSSLSAASATALAAPARNVDLLKAFATPRRCRRLKQTTISAGAAAVDAPARWHLQALCVERRRSVGYYRALTRGRPDTATARTPASSPPSRASVARSSRARRTSASPRATRRSTERVHLRRAALLADVVLVHATTVCSTRGRSRISRTAEQADPDPDGEPGDRRRASLAPPAGERVRSPGRWSDATGSGVDRFRPGTPPSSHACVRRLRLMEPSLPVAERPRRPEWMKVRAPRVRLALLRRAQAHPRREPEHDLRGGALPEHRRVLGPRARRRSRSSATRAPAPAATATSTRASPRRRRTRSSRCASRRPRRRWSSSTSSSRRSTATTCPTAAPATTRRRSAR